VPVISFTFDDFPRSALTIGGRMLSDYGWRGTYYGAMGLMGTTVGAEPMFTRTDVDELLTAGHELACHTLNHTSCYAVGNTNFVHGCEENRREAAMALGGYQLENLSFPHGHITLAAKRHLQAAYHTCRSIEMGINSDPADFGFLRANAIYSRLPIETLKDLIHANTQANGWLIFYTHDVAIDPSQFGCTPDYFAEILRARQRPDIICATQPHLAPKSIGRNVPVADAGTASFAQQGPSKSRRSIESRTKSLPTRSS
jgi:peptidoglycan/xylan/chitin deacetylase (PgdA/CDA1 family)